MTTDPFTPHGQKLLSILQEQDDWVSRTVIARALSQRALSQYSVLILDTMAQRGLIEKRQSPTKKGMPSYEYRVKPPVDNGD